LAAVAAVESGLYMGQAAAAVGMLQNIFLYLQVRRILTELVRVDQVPVPPLEVLAGIQHLLFLQRQ